MPHLETCLPGAEVGCYDTLLASLLKPAFRLLLKSLKKLLQGPRGLPTSF